MRRLLLLVVALAGCHAHPAESVLPSAGGILESHGSALLDTAPKEELRLVPQEAYMRTYLHLFGDLAPLDMQKKLRQGDGALFDTWDDYVSALGFPDYRVDQPRQTQTNALMIAAFERLGVALCDRALEHDWKTKEVTAKERIVFAFDEPKNVVERAEFEGKFDVLHRTFLGYPAKLATTPRTDRFFQLYREVALLHGQAKVKSKLTAPEAGWAAVCYGLVRHPEFHLY